MVTLILKYVQCMVPTLGLFHYAILEPKAEPSPPKSCNLLRQPGLNYALHKYKPQAPSLSSWNAQYHSGSSSLTSQNYEKNILQWSSLYPDPLTTKAAQTLSLSPA